MHACGNVAAAKLFLPEDLVAKTNKLLPDNMRVMDIFRVRNGFNPRAAATSRVYDYLLPWRILRGDDEAASGEARLARFRELLKRFEGTQNYHNYTAGKGPNEMSSRRYMISVTASEPFRAEDDDGTGEELVRVRLHGQSFLLHQIRKMIGMCVLVMRGTMPDAAMVKSLTTEACRLPIAPGLPLALRRIEYKEFVKHRPQAAGIYKEGQGDMSYHTCAAQMDAFGDSVLTPWIARKIGKTYDSWLEYIEINKADVVERAMEAEAADTKKKNKRNVPAFEEHVDDSGDEKEKEG